MKAKINIELFDDSPMSSIEELGLTTKFLKMCYEAAFEKFINNLSQDGLQHTLSVEIEDNTVN